MKENKNIDASKATSAFSLGDFPVPCLLLDTSLPGNRSLSSGWEPVERGAGNLRTMASRGLNKTRDACLEKVELTYRIAKEALAHMNWGSALQNCRIPPAMSGS